MKLLAFFALVALIPWGDARPYETYYAAVTQRCPAKRLDWLAPSILQGELLRYPVGAEARRRMEVGWRTHCQTDSFDSSCGNAVAMHVIIEEGQLDSFVRGLCRDYRPCTEVAICERRSPALAH